MPKPTQTPMTDLEAYLNRTFNKPRELFTSDEVVARENELARIIYILSFVDVRVFKAPGGKIHVEKQTRGK